MTSKIDRLTRWLRERPPGTEIRWHSIHLSAEHPYSEYYIDILIPEFEDPEDGAWVFTVYPTDHDESGEDWFLLLDYDLVLHVVKGSASSHYDPILELTIPLDASLSAAQRSEIEEALGEDGSYEVLGAWSAEVVTRSLDDWCRRIAGRSDLRFVWDRQALPPAFLMDPLEDLGGVGLTVFEEVASPGGRVSDEFSADAMTVAFEPPRKRDA